MACITLKNTSVLSTVPANRELPLPKEYTGTSEAVCTALEPETWPVTEEVASGVAIERAAGVGIQRSRTVEGLLAVAEAGGGSSSSFRSDPSYRHNR